MHLSFAASRACGITTIVKKRKKGKSMCKWHIAPMTNDLTGHNTIHSPRVDFFSFFFVVNQVS